MLSHGWEQESIKQNTLAPSHTNVCARYFLTIKKLSKKKKRRELLPLRPVQCAMLKIAMRSYVRSKKTLGLKLKFLAAMKNLLGAIAAPCADYHKNIYKALLARLI